MPKDIILTDQGSILLCGLAVLVTLFLLYRSDRKQAAVGRRCVQTETEPVPSTNAAQRVSIIPHRLYNCFDMRDLHGRRLPTRPQGQARMTALSSHPFDTC